MQRLPKLIEATALNEAINTFKTFEGGGRLRVLSCVFLPANRPTAAVDPEYFIKFYGKFEYQAEREHLDNSHALFLMGHIPEAIYCDLNRATFPSPSGHDKYAVYPAAVFQNYAQLLGLNSDDHLVFYGGQATAGMLLASRLYWLFRAYGHSGGLSLLNGGFREWVQRFDYHNAMIEPDPEFHLTRGNWTANTEASSGTITFEELTTNSGKTLNTEAILLDARPRAQFEGQEPFDPRLEVSSVWRLPSSYKFKYKTHFDPTQPKPVGCRLPGALNIPAPELFNSKGKLKGPEELKELVQKAGLDIEALKKQAQEKPLVTLCNVGMQASLLATVLDIQLGLGERTRVYNGSMLELKARAPELISEGSRCLEDKEDEWDDEDDNRKYYYRTRNQMH